MSRLRILTWHIHGNYLWYLSQIDHDFYLPVKHDGTPGYGGKGSTFPFGSNVFDIPADKVRDQPFDVILFQHRDNYERDQYHIFSDEQRRLPSVFLQHDPPLDHPTEELHCYDEPNGLLVHVTPFNALMWNSGRNSTRVIEHGVLDHADATYTGEIPRGLVVINNLGTRGRRLGPDIYDEARERIPLDLVGMGSDLFNGLGEVSPPKLAAFEGRYRFLFNPIRYTSLGLAVCEAMMLGMPIVGLATTEMASTIENGVNGFVNTSLKRLYEPMEMLINDLAEARRLGRNAREFARERFNIQRFVNDWTEALSDVTGKQVRSPMKERIAL